MNQMKPDSEALGQAPAKGATVDEWLHWLEAIHPTEIDLGLDRVLLVLRRLFPRKPRARITTVAGTNGKGTTVAAIEALLLAAGRTVGAYTSPHLVRYNERVRLAGREISDGELVTAFERVESARWGVSLTYFEFGTLAAFVAFENAGVEDWILEVGLGGRLDAVNVLDPDVAVITSVDIDHVGFLGDSREVIGFEKAGILRPGIFAVCADPEPPASVLQQASAQKVELRLTGHDYSLERRGADAVTLTVDDEQFALPADPLPIQSVAAGVVVSRRLVPGLGRDAIERCLAGLTLPARFERLQPKPAVIADVGHNPHAARWLAGKLAVFKEQGQRVHAVYGALMDKDIEGVLSAMITVVDDWYLGGLSVPRGLSRGALEQRAGEALSAKQIRSFESVPDAVSAALAQAGPEDVIIVFGSFFTVAEARQLFRP